MLVLYLVGIGVAFMVHPTRRNRIREAKEAEAKEAK
jgi:hypothetical protein